LPNFGRNSKVSPRKKRFSGLGCNVFSAREIDDPEKVLKVVKMGRLRKKAAGKARES
jgi:hypothetical protein